MGYIYSMKNETAVTKERYRRVPVVRPGQKPWGYSEAVASATPVAVKLNVPQVLPLPKKAAPVKRSKASVSVYETQQIENYRKGGVALVMGSFVFLPPAVLLPGLSYLGWVFPVVGAICGVIGIASLVLGIIILRDVAKTEAGIE